MAQVTVIGPYDGDAVDADEMRLILTELANGINNINASQLTQGCVTRDAVADGEVVAGKLGTDSVVAANIKNGEVTFNKLATSGFLVGAVNGQHSGFSPDIIDTYYDITGGSFAITPTMNVTLMMLYEFQFLRTGGSAGVDITGGFRSGTDAPLVTSSGTRLSEGATDGCSVSLLGQANLTKDVAYTLKACAAFHVTSQTVTVRVKGSSIVFPRA